jgi:hypothetical protein
MKRKRSPPADDDHIWRKPERKPSPDYKLNDYLNLLVRQGHGPDSGHPINSHLFDI